MKTSTKIILPIGVAVVLLIAIFFLAPLNDWEEYKRKQTIKGPMYYIAPVQQKESYFGYCLQWWKNTFKNPTIDGGELPEITVGCFTPQGTTVTPDKEE